MKLVIGGVERELQSIEAFRQAHNLPPNFNVNHFEPKDYSGLGSMEGAGAEMNSLYQAIIEAVPASLTLPELVSLVDELELLFRVRLYEINSVIGLRTAELEFAVAGFSDVLQSLVYAVAHAQAAGQPFPPFPAVYANWLNTTVRISANVYHYQHEDKVWQVQVINNAYGRIGLMASCGDTTYYLYDPILACPAEGFMYRLLSDVGNRILVAMGG
ncbi:MAG: hypothetical protein D6712_01370 [Chloroflexi bacterium]|nr:MAG: hypothetical protein D6712_01370 [Chloroflexota bacterium]